MIRFARLLVIVALLALVVPATAGAKKGHKPGRGAQAGDTRGGDRGRDAKPCKEKVNQGKHRGWKDPKPGKGPRPHPRACEPAPTGGDRAFGDGVAGLYSFRFDASSDPNGESPNPGGTETAFVQFTDASGDTYAGPVRCLSVVGNQAVIGFDNQDPESPQIDVILYVEDNASTGASDRFEAEATLSPGTCPSARVPASAVTSGDITVQDNTAGGGGGEEPPPEEPPGDDEHGDDDDDEHGDDEDDVEEEDDDDEDDDDEDDSSDDESSDDDSDYDDD